MPAAASFRKPEPRVQILVRQPLRGGVHPVPVGPEAELAQVQLEIENVFRADVVAEGFGLPQPEMFVRFLFNQNDQGYHNWQLYDPHAPVEFGYDPEWDAESSESIPLPDETGQDDWVSDMHWIMFGSVSSTLPAICIQDLAASVNFRAWWARNGHPDGYQLIFTVAGLEEHRRRFLALDEAERDLIEDTWNFMKENLNDEATLLCAFPFLSDLPSTMRYFASTLGR